MLGKLALGLAVAAAVALGVKLVLTSEVSRLQRDVAQRQQAIAASQVLGQVNGRLIQMLAAASAERNDEALRTLLARNGVRFTVNPPAAPGSQSTPSTPVPEQP